MARAMGFLEVASAPFVRSSYHADEMAAHSQNEDRGGACHDLAIGKSKGSSLSSHVSIELGAVNVFIGANGSGKSNLLEAVGVLGASVFGAVESETLQYRGVRLGVPESYKSSIKSEPSRRLVLRAKSDDAKYDVEFENLLFQTNRLRWRIEVEQLSDNGRQLLIRDMHECVLYSPGHDNQKVKISDDQSAAMLAVRIQQAIPSMRDRFWSN